MTADAARWIAQIRNRPTGRWRSWFKSSSAPAISLIAGRSRSSKRKPASVTDTALTRPNRSAQRLPCGRHAVPTARMVGPNHVVANHRIERRDHLTHDRHDRDLRQFAGGFQTIVEQLERRIPIAGAHRRHVEHLADVRTATPDAAPALERAALEGVRRN